MTETPQIKAQIRANIKTLDERRKERYNLYVADMAEIARLKAIQVELLASAPSSLENPLQDALDAHAVAVAQHRHATSHAYAVQERMRRIGHKIPESEFTDAKDEANRLLVVRKLTKRAVIKLGGDPRTVEKPQDEQQ